MWCIWKQRCIRVSGNVRVLLIEFVRDVWLQVVDTLTGNSMRYSMTLTTQCCNASHSLQGENPPWKDIAFEKGKITNMSERVKKRSQEKVIVPKGQRNAYSPWSYSHLYH